MIWHVVHFDFSATPDEVRADLEQQLADLADLSPVAWLRVGRDIEQPHITGLMTAFASDEDLRAYAVHPDHVPVVDAIRAAGVVAHRFDIEAMDDPADFPA